MEHTKILAAMISPLCSWYEKNKRILPWRKNRDPYRVWVSEIMLQQTRVEAALPYYERFLEALPTVFDLASASEEKILKLWEGLGYYSRVKNMQKAAQTMVQDYGGEFPRDRKLLQALSGIGSYTAGAICSIAFGLPESAVDGNVLRVVARLCNNDEDILLPQTKKRVEKELQSVYPSVSDPGALTQAIMELGALVCIPGVPCCEVCPLCDLCMAYKNGCTLKLPVRQVKTTKKEQKRSVFLLLSNGKVALKRRGAKGPLAGLWEFPGVEQELTEKEAEKELKRLGISESPQKFIKSRHVFTHLIWEMQSFIVQNVPQSEDFLWLSAEELKSDIPLPSAMKPFYQALLEHGVL